MRRGLKWGIASVVFFSSSLLLLSFCCAEEESKKAENLIDLSVGEITFPEKVYEYKKNDIAIVVTNNSDVDVEGCTLTVEASEGSQASQQLVLGQNSSAKVDLKWVPLKSGDIEFKVTLTPPKELKEKTKRDNQVVKMIQVVPQVVKPAPKKVESPSIMKEH